MRRLPHWLRVSIVTLLAIGAVGAALLYIAAIYIPYRKDFSIDPPNQVFQMVFEKPPPRDVTVVSASGRHYLIKQWAWLRIQVKPGAIDPFLRDFVADKPEKADIPEAFLEIRRRREADERYVAQDQERVNWNDVLRLAQPEVYTFFSGPPLDGKSGWLWNGIVIVDRQRNLVFVHAGSD